MSTNDDEIEQLRTENDALRERVEELERVFSLQWTRMSEAWAAWHAAHPGQDDIIPDLGELLSWMLEEMRRRK